MPFVAVLQMPDPTPGVPASRDMHDEVFMYLALVTGAEALVSGDQGLWAQASAMERELGCPIWTVQQLPQRTHVLSITSQRPLPQRQCRPHPQRQR